MYQAVIHEATQASLASLLEAQRSAARTAHTPFPAAPSGWTVCGGWAR